MTALTDAELDALAQALLSWPVGGEMLPNLAHTARALAELRTLRGEAERMRAVVNDAFRAGYDAGWESSGEGHNSEWSRPTFTQDKYEACRDDALAAYRAAKETDR